MGFQVNLENDKKLRGLSRRLADGCIGFDLFFATWNPSAVKPRLKAIVGLFRFQAEKNKAAISVQRTKQSCLPKLAATPPAIRQATAATEIVNR